jgi:hypothetical protein
MNNMLTFLNDLFWSWSAGVGGSACFAKLHHQSIWTVQHPKLIVSVSNSLVVLCHGHAFGVKLVSCRQQGLQILICLSRNWYGYGGKFLYFGSYQGKALQTGISWRRRFRLLCKTSPPKYMDGSTL